MASSKSEAQARISLDAKPFEAGAKKVVAAANQMAAVVTTAFAAAGVALLAAFGAKTIGNVISTAKEVLTFGEEMANAGKKAGLAAGKFYLLNASVEKGIGLKTAGNLIGDNAKVLDRSANTFRDVSIKLWAVGEKIRGFWLGLMERVAPVLSRILDGALGKELVSAGQRFGDALAKAFKTVYQLAKDGKLWDTIKLGFEIAFEYAAEKLLWLAAKAAKSMREAFSGSISGGIKDGFASAVVSVAAFCSGIGLQLAEAVGLAFEKAPKKMVKQPAPLKPPVILQTGNRSIPAPVRSKLPSLDDDDEPKFDVEIRKPQLGPDRSNIPAPVRSKLPSLDDDTPTPNRFAPVSSHTPQEKFKFAPIASHEPVETPKPQQNKDFDAGKKVGQVIVDTIKKDQFTPSKELADLMAKFNALTSSAVSKYDSEEEASPTTTYENNTRKAATGVDSLAAIGAGGNVGLTTVDIQKSQLNELKQINFTLKNLANTPNPTASQRQSNLDNNGISRVQTSSPVGGVSPAGAH